MIGGHYATALVPYTRLERKAPLWLLLIVAMSLDFLLLVFVATGIETAAPSGDKPPDMRFSHDLIPVFGIAIAASCVAWTITRRSIIAIWAAALVLLHEAADLVSGYQHNVFGPDSPALGLNNYMTNPVQALGIEALLILGCLTYFQWHEHRAGRSFATWKSVTLFIVLIVPTMIVFAPQLFGSATS